MGCALVYQCFGRTPLLAACGTSIQLFPPLVGRIVHLEGTVTGL